MLDSTLAAPRALLKARHSAAPWAVSSDWVTEPHLARHLESEWALHLAQLLVKSLAPRLALLKERRSAVEWELWSACTRAHQAQSTALE